MGMIQYPKVAADLKANGYKYYEIGSWWPVTATSPSADYNFPFHINALADAVNSSFVSTAFNRTLLGWTGMSLTGIVRDTYTVEAASRHIKSKLSRISLPARYRKRKTPVLSLLSCICFYRTRLISGRQTDNSGTRRLRINSISRPD